MTYVETVEVRGDGNVDGSHCTGCCRVHQLVSHYVGYPSLGLCCGLCRGPVNGLPQGLPGAVARSTAGRWTYL